MLMTDRNWEIIERPHYIETQFDRRSFNPIANPSHMVTLLTLRRIGASRSAYYHQAARGSSWHHDKQHIACCGSSAIRQLCAFDFREIGERKCCDDSKRTACSEMYLDIGAGHSSDVLIAQRMGYHAYGVDLFSAARHWPIGVEIQSELNARHITADALELPFADCSADYVTSQAMIDLVAPHERLTLYREVRRILKIGGTFAMTGAVLKCGHGFSSGDERTRAETLDWRVYGGNAGFVAQKETE